MRWARDSGRGRRYARPIMTSPTTLEEAHSELTLRLRQQELAAEFASFGLRTDELQLVLDEAARVAAKGMECGLAKVLEYLPGENRFIIRAGTGWRPGTVGHATLGSDLDSPAGYAFRTGQPVLSNHLSTETRFRTPQILIDHSVNRAFNVLVATGEWRYGVLEVDSPDRRDFSISDTAFLETVAATLAQAIAKARRMEELRDSRAFVQGVIDASPDCVKVLSAEGVVEFINERGVALNGFGSAEAVLGRELAALWPPAARDAIREAVRGAAAGGIVRVEEQGPTAGGEPRWWELSFAPHAVARGGPKVIGIARDVSARHRAEEELRNSERGLRLRNAGLEGDVRDRTRERDHLWELGEDLLVVADHDGRMLKINPYWTRLLGWSEGEILHGSHAEFIHPEDLGDVMDALERMRDGGLPVRYENRVRARDGRWRWISWTMSPEPGGRRMTGVGRDVTDFKEQQRQLAMAQDSLRQSQKMEAVGQLTGGLAHDFNNLLTGISGSLDLLAIRLRQGRIDNLTRYIDAAQEASRRAAALTHRLLAFSRRQTLDPKPTDVDRLVAGMADLIGRTVGPAITLDVVAAPGAWVALVDPNQLENALLNLAINARDAMPDGGRLTVEIANHWVDARGAAARDLEAGPYLMLSVSDTGTGMAPEVVERAFDPFFTTKPLGLGTGLGLSMIYGFAKQSGGQARIHSQVGLGTSVTLYLPRHDGGAARDEAPSDDIAAMPRAEQGETVLVVDDEPTVRMLVGEVLADLGYTAIEAADGTGGLKILQSDIRIDLLVTDVGLPGGMNGRQVADAARVLRPGLKVLFITGYAEAAAVGGGHLDAGMAVMTKPFAMDDLAGRIREMITSPG